MIGGSLSLGNAHEPTGPGILWASLLRPEKPQHLIRRSFHWDLTRDSPRIPLEVHHAGELKRITLKG